MIGKILFITADNPGNIATAKVKHKYGYKYNQNAAH